MTSLRIGLVPVVLPICARQAPEPPSQTRTVGKATGRGRRNGPRAVAAVDWFFIDVYENCLELISRALRSVRLRVDSVKNPFDAADAGFISSRQLNGGLYCSVLLLFAIGRARRDVDVGRAASPSILAPRTTTRSKSMELT